MGMVFSRCHDQTGVTFSVTEAKMVLEDWKLMRTRRLRQLNEAFSVYQQYISEGDEESANLETTKARWERESDLIAHIHEAVHQLRDALSTDIFIAHAAAGTPLKELLRSPLEKPTDALLDLYTIHKSLPAINRKMTPQRQVAATNIVDELVSYVRKQLEKVRQAIPSESDRHDEEDEARGIFEFLTLVSHYDDKHVVNSQSTGGFAEEVWNSLDDKLRQELKELTPPLTWGETLYHFLRDLEDNRGEPNADRQRKRVGKYLFPLREFYCLQCDRPFAVDSRHPGCFICKRCRATERKRKERQRKRDNTSSQTASSKA